MIHNTKKPKQLNLTKPNKPWFRSPFMPSGQETDSAYSIMAPGPTQALCCMKKQQLVPIPKVGVSVVLPYM